MHVMDTDIPKGGVGISKSYTSPNTHNKKQQEQDSSESQITNLTNQKSKVQFLETAPLRPTLSAVSTWKQISAFIMLLKWAFLSKCLHSSGKAP